MESMEIWKEVQGGTGEMQHFKYRRGYKKRISIKQGVFKSLLLFSMEHFVNER